MANWVAAHEQYEANDTALRFPSEALVRLFKGTYVKGMPCDLLGKSVLEVGCGSGNNLRAMLWWGMEVSGTEIDEEICKVVRRDYPDADVSVGTNTNLKFLPETFDFLVSWNVLHYETDEERIEAAIAEYARVLKPGGRLFMSTTGEEHPMRRTAQLIKGMRHIIALRGDFREGDVQCFMTRGDIFRLLEKQFTSIVVGQQMFHMEYSQCLHWLIVSAVRR